MNALATIAPGAGYSLQPLREFVAELSELLAAQPREKHIIETGARMLARLVSVDDWLPDSHARPDPARYRQYLLHRDPAARFSVVSFVWGPGQSTPIHDHTVWGLVGVLRGSEISEHYQRRPDGLRLTGSSRLAVGEVEAVSPRIGDIHRVANAHDDRVTISIHAYGADIGAVSRSIYEPGGGRKPFVSGYADAPPLPLWN